MKNKIQRFLVTAGLAVFVIFFTVKCPSNTNFTTLTQPLPASITVTVGTQPMVFGLDTTIVSGSTASGNITGNTLAANSSCQVTSLSFTTRLGSQSFNPPAAGVVGDQPVQINIITPEEAAKPKP
jgi:hypothetical protein